MSTVSSGVQHGVREGVDRVNRELQIQRRTPFSDQAFRELDTRIAEYAVELVKESVRKAKRHQAEGVSSADVGQASEYLVTGGTRRRYRHLGFLGGVFLGAAVSNLSLMMATGRQSQPGGLITFLLTLVGASLIVVHMMKE